MIIAIIMIMLIMAICLVACENTGDNRDNYGFNIQGTNFICLGISSTFDGGSVLFYDKSTKVMYLFVKHGYGAGFTPLYNADGTLKLYEEE